MSHYLSSEPKETVITTHSDSFIVHADYVPTWGLGLPHLALLVLACGVITTGIGLQARISDSERSSRGPKPDAFKDDTTVFILVGTFLIAASAVLLGFAKSSSDNTAVPFIDTIIITPEDCVISSGAGIKSSDTIIAVSDLPEGQKRGTFHVNATCKNAESLQQLLELDETIIPLDQQPVNAS